MLLVASVITRSAHAVADSSGSDIDSTSVGANAQIDLQSGQMALSIPIMIPPGRAQATPSVTLSYSTGSGDGPFGIGWSLPTGSIELDTTDGLPACDGVGAVLKYRLKMGGASAELVESASHYEVRYDGGYTKAVHDGDSNTWIVYTRDGKRLTFGGDASTQGDSSARVFRGGDSRYDPAGCEYTASWALTQIKDPMGNSIEYAYEKVDNLLYPLSIQYGGNLDASNAVMHPFTINFAHSSRAHVPTRYIHGVKVRFSEQVSRIEIEAPVTAGGIPQLIRFYDFEYAAHSGGGVALLWKVHSSDMPPRVMSYSDDDLLLKPPTHIDAPGEIGELKRFSTIHEQAERAHMVRTVMDMNGDGFADVVRLRGEGLIDLPMILFTQEDSWEVHFGSATGTVRESIWEGTGWPDIRFPETLRRSNYLEEVIGNRGIYIETMDINGDGIVDRVDAGDAQWQVHLGHCADSADSFVCGFQEAQAWPAPASSVQRLEGLASINYTIQSIADMNGDGRPDFIRSGSAPDAPWEVFLNTGAGFLPLPSEFSALGPIQIRTSYAEGFSVLPHGYNAPGAYKRELMDFNGDGLPDLVSTDLSDPEYPGRWWAVIDSSGAVDQLVDLDSPEGSSFVLPSGSGWAPVLQVRLNNGKGFDPPIQSAMADNVDPFAPIQAALRRANDDGIGLYDFFDVNGDGLSDRVQFDTVWRVQLNDGAGGLVQDDIEVIPGGLVPGLPGRTVSTRLLQGSSEYFSLSSQDGEFAYEAITDWNGDGLMDRVTSNEAAWRINSIGRASGSSDPSRPWLLTKYEDGLGGTTRVQYEPGLGFANTGDDNVPDMGLPLWVVTGIRRSDGTCESGDESENFDPNLNPCVATGNELLRRFTYSGGRFDVEDKQFLGFAEVVERDVYGNETVSEFSQEDVTRGKLLEKAVYTPNRQHLVERVGNAWEWSAPDPYGRTQVWLASSQYELYDLLGEGSSEGICRVSYNRPPDAWGRIGHSCTLPMACGTSPQVASADACTSSPVKGQIDTITKWADPSPSADSPVREKPWEVAVTYVDEDGQAVLLSKEIIHYDGPDQLGAALGDGQVERGLAKQVESVLTFSHAGLPANPVAMSRYDEFGNVIETLDPRGLHTVIWMDALNLYPEDEWHEGAEVTLHTRSTYDYRVGKVASFEDANQQITWRTYDSRGRLLCEALPGDSLANCDDPDSPFTASRAFRYFDPNTGTGTDFPENLIRVESWARHDAAENQRLVAEAYADALGRTRFSTRRQQVGSSSQLDTIVQGRVQFDEMGRVVLEYPPYVATSGTIDQMPVGVPTAISYELNSSGLMDPLGRPGVVDPPDATLEIRQYLGSVIRTVDSREDWSEIRRDAFERVVERTEGGASEGTLRRVDYSHDGAGRVLSESVNGEARATTSYEYDTLGRVVTVDDPNSGEWRKAYDGLGNLIFVDSPKAFEHTQSQYDSFGRMTKTCVLGGLDAYDPAEFETCGERDGDATFEYDAPDPLHHGLGRLWRTVEANVSTELRYDARGRTTYQRKEILGRSAEFDQTFNSAGQVETVVYPDGDALTYVYRSDGLLASMTLGSLPIVADLEYDRFGALSLIVRGNGVEDSFERHDHAENWRLRSIRSQLPASPAYLDLEYFYDDVGKIQQINDLRPVSSELSNQVSSIQYDALGRINMHTSAAGGTESFTFDAFDNLTRPGKTEILYEQQGAPNQIDSIDGAAVQYDANGNRSYVDAHPAFGAAQRYRYDGRGHLVFAHEDGFAQDASLFLYDYADQLVYEGTWSNGVETPSTFYFGDGARAADGWLYKRVMMGDLLVAEVATEAPEFSTLNFTVPEPARWVLFSVGVVGLMLLATPNRRRGPESGFGGRGQAIGGVFVFVFGMLTPLMLWVDPSLADAPEEGGVHHFHFDHIGSTQAITDGSGSLVYQVRYDAYGNVRGRYDGDGMPIVSGVSRREFGGYVSHAATGLQLAGMRIYDPLTGQFLQHDPAGQFTNPYTYGPGDPMNGRDPTGAIFGMGLLMSIFVGLAAASVVAYAVYVGVTTGDVGEAFAALFLGGIKLFLAVASILVAPLSAAAGAALSGAQQFAQIAGLSLIGLNQWSDAIASDTFGAALMGASIGLMVFGLAAGLAGRSASGGAIEEELTQPGEFGDRAAEEASRISVERVIEPFEETGVADVGTPYALQVDAAIDSIGVTVEASGDGPSIGTIEVTQATSTGPSVTRHNVNLPSVGASSPRTTGEIQFAPPASTARSVRVTYTSRIGSASVTVAGQRAYIRVRSFEFLPGQIAGR